MVVTGAAGQIAYSLLYQLAKGDVFGDNQPLSLHLLDIEPMMGVLNGMLFFLFIRSQFDKKNIFMCF